MLLEQDLQGVGNLIAKVPIIGTIIKVAATLLCGGNFVCGVIAGAATTSLIAGMTGGSSGQALKAGLITIATAVAFTAVGDFTGHTPAFGSVRYLENVAGHAGVGCLISVASGGSCKSGAASAAVGAAAAPPDRWYIP